MFNQTPVNKHGGIGQLVPGYGFYDRLGGRLAETLVTLVEGLLSLCASLRRR
jgi:hypothetical protein